MKISQTLHTQRQVAAFASEGISNKEIYNTFIHLLKQFNLKGDCLDFGAGIGDFSRQLQALNRFSSITAIDIMQPPAQLDKSIKWISCDLNNPTNILEHSFDTIVSIEVIEHLENPRAVVREWFRLLRPNGTLIFSTPNNESWRALLALILQGHFVLFGDSSYPAHITPLLRKDIQRILNEVGFYHHQYFFTNVGSIPKFPHIHWQTISAGILKGLRYSDNLIVVAQKAN